MTPGEDPRGGRLLLAGLTLTLITATSPARAITDEEIFRDFRFNFINPGARSLGLGGAFDFSEVSLLVRSGEPPAAMIGSVSAAMRRLDPDLAVQDMQPVPEIIDDSVKAQRLSTATLAIFAAVALALAGLGVYGVLANVVLQQAKEIGLRIALGATSSSVLWLLLRRALRLTAIGVALGLAGSLAVTRLMSGLLYEVNPHDAVAFVAGAAGLALLVLLAALAPARRATRVDPIAALRME